MSNSSEGLDAFRFFPINRKCLCHLLFLFLFVSLETSLFPSILYHLPFPLCMASTSYVFPVLFLRCDHGLDF